MRHLNLNGFVDSLLKDTLPMRGRMVHGRTNTGDLFEDAHPYDLHGRVR